MSASLPYAEVADALTRLGYAEGAAEFHGALCGGLCAQAAETFDPLGVLQRERALDDAAAADAVRRLAGLAATALSSSDMEFTPLLPDDEEPLALRVQALASWCEGFLYGLSTGRPLDMKRCSAEFKEILRDFTQFTQAALGEGDDREIEEGAYTELVEYIRVGAQLIFLELHGSRAGEGKPARPVLH